MGKVENARVRVVGRRPEPEGGQVLVEHLARSRRISIAAGSGSSNSKRNSRVARLAIRSGKTLSDRESRLKLRRDERDRAADETSWSWVCIYIEMATRLSPAGHSKIAWVSLLAARIPVGNRCRAQTPLRDEGQLPLAAPRHHWLRHDMND
ncbi:hypothetical protein VTK26DRAFT_5450 [Humicola hyalothermophila]